MGKKQVKAWMLTALGGALMLGCESAYSRRMYSEDPLLLTRQPVEGKIVDGGPPLLVLAEPVAPQLPATALAAEPPLLRPDAPFTLKAARPGAPTASTPRAPVQAIPVKRSPAVDEPPPPTPPEPRGVEPPPPTPPAPRTVEPPPPTPPEPRADEPPQPMPPEPRAVPAIPVKRSTVEPSLPSPPAPVQAPGTYGHAQDYSWLQGVLDKHYHGHLDLRYCDPTMDDAWGGKVCLERDPRLEQFKEGQVIIVEGELIRDRNPLLRGHYYPHYRVREVRPVRQGN